MISSMQPPGCRYNFECGWETFKHIYSVCSLLLYFWGLKLKFLHLHFVDLSTCTCAWPPPIYVYTISIINVISCTPFWMLVCIPIFLEIWYI
eukprot:jgi/Botrbrau1/15792/Bobra.4_1s0143.1